MSQFFTSGGQSIGVSASASVFPMNIQDWFPSGLTGWISLQSKGLSSLLQHHSSKASIPQRSAFFIVQLSYPYMTTGKTVALTRWNLVGKVMPLLFNMVSRLVIAFLPRSKGLLISWLQSPSAVVLEPPKIVCHCFHCFPIYLSWSDWTGCHDFSFLNVLFLASFFSLLFHFHQEAWFLFAFCHEGVVICISEVIDISPGNLDSSLCFIQPGISHDVLCTWVK